MKRKVFLVLGLICYQTQAQDLTIYRAEQTRKVDSLLNFKDLKDDKKWLNLLPNVNYNAIDNSVSVGVNLNSYARYFEQTQRNKIQIEALKLTKYEAIENRIERLQKEYFVILSEYETLLLGEQMRELKIQEFELKKKQYDENKLTLEQYIISKQKFDSYIISELQSVSKTIIKLEAFLRQTKSSSGELELNILFDLKASLKSLLHEQR